MHRVLEPELLDHLPPDDPSAVHSRRDLRRVNLWMRNGKHLFDAIGRLPRLPVNIVEIGAGDGTFLLGLARGLHRARKLEARLTLLDLQPVVQQSTLREFAKIGWTVEVLSADVREWLSATGPRVDLVIANLFLHHFADLELSTLFEQVAERTDAFMACDPRRWLPAIISTKLLWCIGCNHVTRHDAQISVRAGFTGGELSRLWPEQSGFAISEYEAGYASHLFTAIRNFAAAPSPRGRSA